MNKINILAILFLVLAMVACKSTSNVDKGQDGMKGMDGITSFSADNIFPEGIEFTDGSFLVSSLNTGNIGKVDQNTMDYSVFIEDDWLVSVVGITVDTARERLLVTNSNNSSSNPKSTEETFLKKAGLGVYDLNTGENIARIDLEDLTPDAEARIANDITFDKEGNIYVTDSFVGVIYKVSADLESKEIFVADDRLAIEGNFGANGIVYYNGMLIVVNMGVGSIFSVDMDGSINEIDLVGVDNLSSADGLYVQNDMLFVVINGGTGAEKQLLVFDITSENNTTLTLHSNYSLANAVFPTTVVAVGNKAHVIDSSLTVMGSEDVMMYDIYNFSIK